MLQRELGAWLAPWSPQDCSIPQEGQEASTAGWALKSEAVKTGRELFSHFVTLPLSKLRGSGTEGRRSEVLSQVPGWGEGKNESRSKCGKDSRCPCKKGVWATVAPKISGVLTIWLAYVCRFFFTQAFLAGQGFQFLSDFSPFRFLGDSSTFPP